MKINIHFVNHSKLLEGFTPTHDHLGNPYSGYDYAIDITKITNIYKHKDNVSLHLPNFQKLTTIPKNYEVVLDAVYFHEDDLHSMPVLFKPYNKFYIEADEVMNVFLPSGYSSRGWSGYADLGLTFSNALTQIWQVTKHAWQAYKRYKDSTAVSGFNPNHLWDGFVPFCQTLAHELGHNLGLGHPTQNCPCLGGSTNFPSNTCDDFLNPINDTPTAYEMYQSYGKHPSNNLSCANRCSWGSATQTSCSNNLMDYTNGIALSPKQIEFIHIALEGGFYNNNPHPFLKRYTVCESILQDRDYCDLPYHKFSFYGKKIKIGGCADSPSEIIVHSKGAAKKIYFSQSVDFYQTTDFRSSTLIFEMQPYIPQTDPILDIRFADCSVNFKYK